MDKHSILVLSILIYLNRATTRYQTKCSTSLCFDCQLEPIYNLAGTAAAADDDNETSLRLLATRCYPGSPPTDTSILDTILGSTKVFPKYKHSISVLQVLSSNLTAIPSLRSLPLLSSLDFSNNSLDHILAQDQFNVYKRVTELNLQRNVIQRLRRDEFISFPNLKTLDLSKNKISSVHELAFRLLQLRKLSLSSNTISNLQQSWWRFVPALESLDLSCNQLVVIPDRAFFYITGLKFLNISGNLLAGTIKQFTFYPLEALETLDLSWNKLYTFPVESIAKLPNITSLYFDGNQIEVLGENSLFNKTSLQNVFLRYSHTLSLVLSASFLNLPKLKLVDMSNSSLLTYVSDGAFQNCSKLELLNFSDSNLYHISKSMIRGMPRLRSMDLFGNSHITCGCTEQHWILRPLRKNLNIRPSGNCSAVTRVSLMQECRQTLLTSSSLPHILHQDEAVVYGVSVNLGSTARLYCMQAVGNSSNNHIVWYKDLNTARKRIRSPRIKPTYEFLMIQQTRSEDSGRYICEAKGGSSNNQKLLLTFDLTIIEPDIDFDIALVGDRYVIVRWNTSQLGFDNLRDFQIYIQRDGDGAARNHSIIDHTTIYLQSEYRFHRFSPLLPETNYTICLRYVRSVILHEECIRTKTLQRYQVAYGMRNLSDRDDNGWRLDVIIIGGALCFLIGLIGTICAVQCIFDRLHALSVAKRRRRWSATEPDANTKADNLYDNTSNDEYSGSNNNFEHITNPLAVKLMDEETKEQNNDDDDDDDDDDDNINRNEYFIKDDSAKSYDTGDDGDSHFYRNNFAETSSVECHGIALIESNWWEIDRPKRHSYTNRDSSFVDDETTTAKFTKISAEYKTIMLGKKPANVNNEQRKPHDDKKGVPISKRKVTFTDR